MPYLDLYKQNEKKSIPYLIKYKFKRKTFGASAYLKKKTYLILEKHYNTLRSPTRNFNLLAIHTRELCNLPSLKTFSFNKHHEQIKSRFPDIFSQIYFRS